MKEKESKEAEKIKARELEEELVVNKQKID